MENRVFWIIAAVIVLVVGVVLFQPTVEEQLAPKLDSAWVAIEIDGSGISEVGSFVLEQGQGFKLRAVAGARKRDGSPVYYTEAEKLIIAGEEIPPEQIKRWDRSKPIKIRWYTVEGRFPYFPLDAEVGIAGFEFQEFLRSDWPLTWSTPGDINAAHDDHLAGTPHMPSQPLGTPRYRPLLHLIRSPTTERRESGQGNGFVRRQRQMGIRDSKKRGQRGLFSRRSTNRIRGECLNLCVSERAHAVFKYGQASKRPANIMAS